VNSTGRAWAPGGESALSLAVVAPSERAAQQAVGLIERAGLNVTPDLIITGRVTFDALALPPDIVLIDCGRDAAEAVELARRELLGSRIVVIFSEGEDDPYGIFRAGADALVARSEAAITLAVAVLAVVSGQLSVPLSLRDLVEPPTLTHREKQVLGLMADGLTNAQIGRRLYLAESTVKTHLSNAFKRLGVRTRREASARLLAADPALRHDVLAALERARSGLQPADEPLPRTGGTGNRSLGGPRAASGTRAP
jgi:DNA-binding NarL/FixJ family response regulator